MPQFYRRETLTGAARSVGSAFIFGVSLLYTMEVWWAGMMLPLWLQALFVFATFLSLVFMGYIARLTPGDGLKITIIQALEALAVGVFSAVLFLFVLNRVNIHDPFPHILGKILMVCIPLMTGAFLACLLFPVLQGRKEARGDDAEEERKHPIRETFSDVGATMAGGIFVGLAIAPTEEIPMLATEMSYWHEISLVILSLVLSYVIVFAATEEAKGMGPPAFLQRPIVETTLSYCVSVVLAFVMLYFYGQVKPGHEPLISIVSQTIALAFPVTIGGAAGRLAV